jgi:hypothetical protein
MGFTLKDIQNSAVGHLNTHLFEVAKKRKYNNVKVEIDGHKFDSKKEARRFIELRALQVAGEISELKLQVPFQLSVCKYIADFTYKLNGELVVEDVKSKATRKLPTYRIKCKMMENELKIKIKEV